MSDETPYKDDFFEQLNNLPLPDENEAWEEMKKLLDSDRRQLLPPFFKIFMGALAGVFFCLIIWVILFSLQSKNTNQKSANSTGGTEQLSNNAQSENKNAAGKNSDAAGGKTSDSTLVSERDNQASPAQKNDSLNKPGTPQNSVSNRKIDTSANVTQPVRQVKKDDLRGSSKKMIPAGDNKNAETTLSGGKRKLNGTVPVENRGKMPRQGRNVNLQQINNKANIANKDGLENPQTFVIGDSSIEQNKQPELPGITSAQNNRKDLNKDISVGVNSITQGRHDSVLVNNSLANTQNQTAAIHKDSSATGNASNVNTSSKKLPLEVGIAEQQPIRLDCNCVYQGNTYNNLPAVKDYIPSIYLRLYPAKNWFIQLAFKYNAPEYVDESLYKMSVQNLPLNYITTSYVLKKVYYNQVPLSFNYFVLPNWSFGAGIMLNNFSGGVSQRNIRKKIFGSADDSLISSNILTGTTDSLFGSLSKNNLQGIIESEYRWKFFSIGARYAFDLQPYFKYNNPLSGDPVEKKNSTLNIFVSVELWSSVKRKR
ncbi:MAG TPA: hypothetical protein VG738_07290 [Chitinophagaceae bacterium]|nr:hypothetical protein [Chitinophagaceae bacterium]